MKTPSNQYGNSQCKDLTVLQQSYIYAGQPIPGKSLYIAIGTRSDVELTKDTPCIAFKFAMSGAPFTNLNPSMEG